MASVEERDIAYASKFATPLSISSTEAPWLVLIGKVEALYLQHVLDLVSRRSRRVFKFPNRYYAEKICKELSRQMRAQGWPVSGCY